MIMDEALFVAMVEADLDEEPLSRENLESILGEIVNDSDACLKASAWFFGLDVNRLEEKAATFEYDGGLSRVTANRLALKEAIQSIAPGVSDSLCRWFSRNAAIVRGIAEKHSFTVDQARREVLSYARRHNGTDSEAAQDMDMLLERIP